MARCGAICFVVKDAMTNEQIAALATHVRARLGGIDEPVTVDDVAEILSGKKARLFSSRVLIGLALSEDKTGCVCD